MNDLRVVLSLFTGNFDQGLANATRSVQLFQRNTQRMGTQIANSLNFTGINISTLISPWTAAGAAIGGITSSVIENLVKFEKSMDNFQSILGVTKKEMEYFTQEAIRLGSTTTQTASQVAEAFTMIAGRLPQLLEAKEGLVAVTLAAITLAEAAGITVDEAGKALADSINQTGASAYDAERYINVLAAGSRNGAADITYLNRALEKFGSIGATVGMSFEELIAAIETIAPKVTEASSAGIYLRQVLLSLEKLNDNNLKPSVVGLTKALENLAAKLLTISDYARMFDTRAVITALTLVEQRDKFNELTAKVTDTNTAYELAATRTDNVKGAIVRLSSAWEELTLTIKDSTGPLKNFLDGTAKVVGNLTDAYLKLADAEAYESKKASENAAAKWRYDTGRLLGIINSTKYMVNPETGKNYTEKEAAQYLKKNYKEYFVELKVIDSTEKNFRDNAINAYLDDLISKQEKLNKIQQEETVTNELRIAQLKRLLELTTDLVERAAILLLIKDLGGSVKNNEALPKGSLAELDLQIASLRKGLNLAINNEDRIRINAELDALTEKRRVIEFEYKYPDIHTDRLEPNSLTSIAKPELPTEFPKINNPITDNSILLNNEYAQSLNAIASIMGAVTNMTNEGAAAWLSYGANIITSVATAIPVLTTLTTALTAKAAAEAAGSAAVVPVVGWINAVAAVSAIVAAMASVPKFTDGGIIGGNSFIGDNLIARVNSGEMILNNRQQKNLFNLLDGKGGNAISVGDVKFRIEGRDLVGILNSQISKTSKYK